MTNKPPSRPTTKPALHVVVSGDTLSGIAHKYGVSLDDLLKWNAEITNPNRISVGQKINLAADSSQDQVYVIQPGDTVSKLAERFGKSWLDIQAVNHLKDVNRDHRGQDADHPRRVARPAGLPVRAAGR